MQPVTGGLFAWPGREHLRLAAVLAAGLAVLFAAVFIGTDFVTGLRSERLAVHFGFEPGLPLVPELTLVYMSVYAPFVAMPFVLRTRSELIEFAVRAGAMTVCAGVLFLLIPAELAFPDRRYEGALAALLEFADWLNLDYNLVPSLHVAYGTLSMAAWWPHLAPIGRVLAAGWVLALAVSAVLTHQHHVVDVAAGAVLGWLSHRVWQHHAGSPAPRPDAVSRAS